MYSVTGHGGVAGGSERSGPDARLVDAESDLTVVDTESKEPRRTSKANTQVISDVVPETQEESGLEKCTVPSTSIAVSSQTRKRKRGAPKGETIRYARDPPPRVENTEKGLYMQSVSFARGLHISPTLR